MRLIKCFIPANLLYLPIYEHALLCGGVLEEQGSKFTSFRTYKIYSTFRPCMLFMDHVGFVRWGLLRSLTEADKTVMVDILKLKFKMYSIEFYQLICY